MRQSTRSLFLVLALTFVALFVVFSGARLSAAQNQPDAGEGLAATTDDGGTPEIGVEWITDWPGTANDRANWYHSATRLYNEIKGAGWIGRFNYGNTSAWEKDFKHVTYGGINDQIIDAVDLAMIGTHGSSAWDSYYGKTLSSVYFSTNNHDLHLSPGEARRAYGNNDLEWLAFDSCLVLRDSSMWYWYQTFDGLHLMLSFANVMYVVYPGDGGVWGDQMQAKGWWIFGHGAKTVTQAWFTAVEDQQPSGVRARVLAETLDSYNDYIWGQGYVSPDYPNNGAYWYWDHVSGTPDLVPLPPGDEPTSLPGLRVASRTVDEDYVKMIGGAFGLTSEVLTSPDGRFMYMVGGADDEKQLRVDTASGGYFYQDLGELWTDPERPRDLPPSGERAAGIAIAFLNQNDYLPGQFDRQRPPTVELEGPAEGHTEDTPAIGASHVITSVNYAVHYGRTALVPGGELSIVGPGSRQNVYVGDGNAIIGLKGGGRDYQLTGETIPIISSDEAWNAFVADPTIAVADIPLTGNYDRTGKLAPTLGYYEQPSALGQSEFIPVWIFQADLLVDVEVPAATGQAAGSTTVSEVLAEDVWIYVPAAADEEPLVASIDAPGGGQELGFGEKVDLSGSASGGTTPYTYEWSSNVDGFLGTGATLSDVSLTADTRGPKVEPNIVTLTVLDGNGIVATDTVAVNVSANTFLPSMSRE